MSFRVDLWNGFETIKSQINSMQRKMKQFVKIMNMLVNIEKDYTKSIDQLLRENREIIKTGYNFDDSLFQMIEDIKEENANRKTYYSFLAKSIINPLQETLSSPKTEFSKTFIDNEESKGLYNKALTDLILKQDNFHNNCQELCYFLVEHEIDKINCEKNNNTTLLQNKNYQGRQQKIMEKLNNSKDEYIAYLNDTNIEREKYNEITEQRLEFLEKFYRNTFSLFRQKALLYASFRLKVLEKHYNREKDHYDIYEKNTIDNEIFDFVLKNCTREFPLPKIEFCPFKTNIINSRITAKYQQKYTNQEYNRIYQTMNNFFIEKQIFPTNLIQTGISKLHKKIDQKLNLFKKGFTFFGNINNQDSETNEKEKPILDNIKYIEKFINDIISLAKNNNQAESKIIKEKLIDNFGVIMLLLSSKNNKFYFVYMETFIKSLSNNRSKGNTLLTDEVFKILKDIFFLILDDEKFKLNDYVLKNILILSQTFYCIDEKTNEKIYIQNGIKNHLIFDKPETWHRIINYSLNLGLVNLNDVNSSLKISKEEQIQKLQKMAFNTVVSYLCDLKLLTDNTKVFEIIKNYYVKIYNMDIKKVNNYIIIYFKGMGIDVNLNENDKNTNKNVDNNIIKNGNSEKTIKLMIEKRDNLNFYTKNNNTNLKLKQIEDSNNKFNVDPIYNNKNLINENEDNKIEKKAEENVEGKKVDEKVENKTDELKEEKSVNKIVENVEEKLEKKMNDRNENEELVGEYVEIKKSDIIDDKNM